MTPTIALAAPTGVAVMPMRRVLGAYLTEARYETVRMMRAPMFAIPFTAIPILLYLFFGVVIAGGSRNADAPENLPLLLLTGFSVMGVMGPGIFGFGVSIAMERDQGLTRLKRAQPMPPMAYLAAKMVMALLFSAVVVSGIGVLGMFVRHVPITIGQLMGMVLVESIGTLPFCAIGLFIGSLDRPLRAGVRKPGLPAADLPVGALLPAAGEHPVDRALLAGVPLEPAGAGRRRDSEPTWPVGATMSVAALVGVTVLFAGLAVRNLSIEPAN